MSSLPPSLIKPPPLQAGDTVGIVAPSLPLKVGDPAQYERGKAILQQMGFQLREGATLGLTRWWSAGTPQQQADDIHRLFADAEVKAIITLTGGFSALHVLPLLDFDLIAANPKPFIGLSDTTQYQLAMLARTGLVGFHGNDLLNGFGWAFDSAETDWQHAIQSAYTQLLTTSQPLGPLPTLGQRECWRAGTASGRLIGGNLKRVTALIGTPYFPDLRWFNDAILFVEEIGETLYDITLDLRKFELAGILERIGGLVIGELTWVNRYFDHLDHPSKQAAILDTLANTDFPILKMSEFGHNMCMLPLPIGVNATLDASALQLSLIEAATEDA